MTKFHWRSRIASPPYRIFSLTTVAAGLAGIVVLATSSPVPAAEEVNVYSYRQPELIQPLLDAFSAETDVKANVVYLNKGLVERIQSEGRNSPADVILTVDVGRLDQARKAGITQTGDERSDRG